MNCSCKTFGFLPCTGFARAKRATQGAVRGNSNRIQLMAGFSGELRFFVNMLMPKEIKIQPVKR